MKKCLLIVGLLLAGSALVPAPAAAQNTNPNLVVTTWWFSDPIPPGWFNYGPYPGTFVFLIAAYKNGPPCQNCCPAGNGGQNGGCQASSPVHLATGNTYIDSNDVSLPGLGGGIHLSRRWNSVWQSDQLASSIGIFGNNWRSSYEERVFMDGNNYLRYSRGNGDYWSFGWNGNGTFVVSSPAKASATLSVTSTSWQITFLSGEKRFFSLSTGQLTSIVDRNGNTTTIGYDAYNRLATVTDPVSRHIYFNYPNNTSYLVTSVTSDFGTTYLYQYDSSNRLSQVTAPDLTTTTYTYNSANLITQVTDSNGKVIEAHTYDSSGRGLTSSKANGVELVTITYPH